MSSSKQISATKPVLISNLLHTYFTCSFRSHGNTIEIFIFIAGWPARKLDSQYFS